MTRLGQAIRHVGFENPGRFAPFQDALDVRNRLPFNPDVRLAFDTLADTLDLRIQARDEAEHHRELVRLRSLEDAVVSRLGAPDAPDRFFCTAGAELCGMLAADGFAAVQGGAVYPAGRCPPTADLMAIAKWVEGLDLSEPFIADQLPEQARAAGDYAGTAKGLLVVTVPTEQPTVLLWFRAELARKPGSIGTSNEAAEREPETPSTRGASWADRRAAGAESSRPWTQLDLESAGRLMRTTVDARQNRRMRELNRGLSATLEDHGRKLIEKDILLKEVSHRTQNSLQLVSAFLSLQARSVADPSLTGHLGEAQRRISAVALVHRRLYGDGGHEMVDLSSYLDDLVIDMKSSMDEAWRDQITVELVPMTVSADHAIKLGLILTELIINANKYAYQGRPGPISVALERQGSDLRLTVADRGAGRTGGRVGFGSRMIALMVAGIRGTFDETANAPGFRGVVTAPIA